jgi:tRNA(adenine34) deaminase
VQDLRIIKQGDNGGEGIVLEERFMRKAIEMATIAHELGDYAIGAVLVLGRNIIAACHQRLIQDQNPIGHAEILAIQEGSRILKNKHLDGCVLYSTHEPCPMCASAIVWAKLKGVVFGARMSDMKEFGVKGGNSNFTQRIINIPCREVIQRSGLKIEIVQDYMREECLSLFHLE